MSRRSRRREDGAERTGAERRPEGDGAQGGPPERRPGGRGGRDGGAERPRGRAESLGARLAFLAGVFLLAVLVAELFGAANLGVALGVGQIAVAVAVVYLILRP